MVSVSLYAFEMMQAPHHAGVSDKAMHAHPQFRQDYVLDQLLSGRDNPLARAVAQASLEDNAPVLSVRDSSGFVVACESSFDWDDEYMEHSLVCKWNH